MMMNFALIAGLAVSSILGTAQAAPLIPPRPKLVVLIVIDQFRADYLMRFQDRFLPARTGSKVGGFRYLVENGAYYPTAEYTLLQSMTCPGHATLLTGAQPYQMGIPLNGWMDVATQKYVYCAEDAAHPTVGANRADHAGTSPKNLWGTTVGDELKNAGFNSRVVTVSLKDRAAIMMGGHRADLATWMDKNSHAWVSSTFYLPDGKLPAWIDKLNAEITAAEKGKTMKWVPEGEGSGLSDPTHHPLENTAHIGTTFPHELPFDSKWILASPYGLELTETMAERAIDAYRLGANPSKNSPDLFAVSFSSHDYVAHGFGPNSREAEEMTVAEDRQISKLLNHLAARVPGGLKDVVIALTADHGGPPDPDFAKSKRMDAGRVDEKTIVAAADKRLNEKFGKPSNGKDGKETSWILGMIDFNAFVNLTAVNDRKAPLPEVLAEFKAAGLATPGIAQAFTRFEHEQHKLPPGAHGKQAEIGYYPGRNGDVVFIPRPYWMNADGDTVVHETGYNYDHLVPLVLTGPRIKHAFLPQRVQIIDLAPTLSHLLGVLPPALSEGRVLTEILK